MNPIDRFFIFLIKLPSRIKAVFNDLPGTVRNFRAGTSEQAGKCLHPFTQLFTDMGNSLKDAASQLRLLLILLFLLNLYLEVSRPGKLVFIHAFFPPLLLLLLLVKESRKPDKWFAWERAGFWIIAVTPFATWPFTGIADKLAAVAIWMLSGAILLTADRFFEGTEKAINATRSRMAESGKRIKDAIQETAFYSDRIKNLKIQMISRINMSSFAREMGMLLEQEKITQLLTGRAQSIFQGERVALLTVAPTDDPIDAWITERKMPILVKDFLTDVRFTTAQASVKSPAYFPDREWSGQRIRSTIAAPLTVEKTLMGMVRVDSATPDRFSENDLEQLELMTNLSTLALQNANLFARVKAMATRDALTGLSTHRIFQERMVDEILRAARYHTPLSLLMLDIDHFKLVNDQHGHLAGDHVLKEIGQILLLACREVDFAARYGGEEFTLILPGIDAKEAWMTAENIRRKISDQKMAVSGRIFNVTASIGCSFFPQDAQIASQLIRSADERLYRAKSTGRNRVIVS